jgi:hypothetical protein
MLVISIRIDPPGSTIVLVPAGNIPMHSQDATLMVSCEAVIASQRAMRLNICNQMIAHTSEASQRHFREGAA